MSFLLKEDGDKLLQENNDKIVLDEASGGAGTSPNLLTLGVG